MKEINRIAVLNFHRQQPTDSIHYGGSYDGGLTRKSWEGAKTFMNKALFSSVSSMLRRENIFSKRLAHWQALHIIPKVTQVEILIKLKYVIKIWEKYHSRKVWLLDVSLEVNKNVFGRRVALRLR
jgi:hypothetical protein